MTRLIDSILYIYIGKKKYIDLAKKLFSHFSDCSGVMIIK